MDGLGHQKATNMNSVSSYIKNYSCEEYSLLDIFDSRRSFLKKLGVYLKKITGSSCKFKIDRISSDFIVLEIYYPSHYKKGIKISSFLDFFGLDRVIDGKIRPSEAREDGERASERESELPVIWGGGGG